MVKLITIVLLSFLALMLFKIIKRKPSEIYSRKKRILARLRNQD